jgi:hypothetical protein
VPGTPDAAELSARNARLREAVERLGLLNEDKDAVIALPVLTEQQQVADEDTVGPYGEKAASCTELTGDCPGLAAPVEFPKAQRLVVRGENEIRIRVARARAVPGGEAPDLRACGSRNFRCGRGRLPGVVADELDTGQFHALRAKVLRALIVLAAALCSTWFPRRQPLPSAGCAAVQGLFRFRGRRPGRDYGVLSVGRLPETGPLRGG